MVSKTVWIIIVVVIVVLIWIFGFGGNDVMFSPLSDTTDVSVTVNAAPTIVASSIIVDGDGTPLDFDTPTEDVDLIQAGTKLVNVQFVANDVDDNLNDATATAQFTKSGEVDRPLAGPQACTCVLNCATDTRTYECATTGTNAIGMDWYDENAADWTVTVAISDTLGIPATSGTTDIFTVNLLRDITIEAPKAVSFPTVSQGGTNIVSSANTLITNNGNFDWNGASGDSSIDITATNLDGETTPAENIPAANFKAADDTESASYCPGASGTTLAVGTTSVPSIVLPRGDGVPVSNQQGEILYCITLVPGGISSQVYSATVAGGDEWTVVLP